MSSSSPRRAHRSGRSRARSPRCPPPSSGPSRSRKRWPAPAGVGQAPARQASIGAGIPDKVGAVTVNKVCGSGLKAVVFGANAITAGEHDLVVAGGMESMTNAPYLLPKAREGYRLGHAQVIDSMIADGLWDAYGNVHMGDCAEL